MKHTISIESYSEDMIGGLADVEDRAKQIAKANPGRYVKVSRDGTVIVSYRQPICVHCGGTGHLPTRAEYGPDPEKACDGGG